MRPGFRVTIDVDYAENHEQSAQSEAQFEQQRPSLFALQEEKGSKTITGGHDTKPRDQRVWDNENYLRTQMNHPFRDQQFPHSGKRAESFGLDPVTQVVQGDDGYSHDADDV